MPSITLPVAIVGAAAVGTAGSLAASSNAASVAQNAANQNNALQSSIYSQNSANAQPYIQSGDQAETALDGFLGLGGSPAASQAALNSYLNSTGYQFNLDQGLNAVQQSKASAGLLGSGSTLTALDNYATGEANQYGQQYEQNLQGVVNTGQSAVNSLTGAGQNYANAVSSNNNSAANAAANAGVASAGSVNSLIGSALSAYGLTKGGTSFGGGSNAFTGNGNSVIGG